MFRQILSSKIHGATVTEARIDYVGSISIDADLLKESNIVPYEKVLIANLTNGSRIESYAIEGRSGSGEICLNGGAAKHGKPGDTVIIMTFVAMTDDEIRSHIPKVVKVDKKNKIIV